MTSQPAKMLDLRVSVDEEIVDEVRADGLIISTPSGSTAYAMSAGGPIVDPRVDAAIIIPICPFKLNTRPKIVPADSIITVKFLKEGKKVTLKCGEYLIDRELVGNKSYTLYRVTDWNDDKEYEANDSKTIYNLSKNGKLVLDNYYEKDLLVTMLNEKTDKKYDSLKEIEKDYKLVSKKVYRRKTKIREVTN